MAYLGVIVAALAGFGLGALYYNLLSKQWIAASGIKLDDKGQPAGGAGPKTFALAFLCILIVAGMMRHMMAASGITTPVSGLVAGGGVGLFFISPWITLNVLYSDRPLRLAAIDGGYAVIACAAMGLILALFAR
ncbi:MAG: DUF1761 domain-containing protein [Pararhodobacter sp.]